MRYRHIGIFTNMCEQEALRNADLTTTLDGLNALGRVPWKINHRILEVAQKCWEDNIPLGDIPSQTDFELPPEPTQPDTALLSGMDKESPEYLKIITENRRYREALNKYNRIRQKNMVRVNGVELFCRGVCLCFVSHRKC